jgi:hypothetical protein
MAKVTLSTQSAAEAPPYNWRFRTFTTPAGVSVWAADSLVNGTRLEMTSTVSLAQLLTKLSGTESFRSDNGKSSHLS